PDHEQELPARHRGRHQGRGIRSDPAGGDRRWSCRAELLPCDDPLEHPAAATTKGPAHPLAPGPSRCPPGRRRRRKFIARNAVVHGRFTRPSHPPREMSGGRHRRRTTRPRAAGALAAWVVFGLTIALAAPLTAQAETSPETPSPSPSP